MRHILFLSHISPYPIIGGDKVRISQSLDFLSRHFIVDVAYLSHETTDISIKIFQPNISEEYRFYIPPLKRYIQASRCLINRKALVVNHYHNRQLQEFVDRNIARYDFIFCASPVMASYVMKHANKQRYLDMTDSLSMNRFNASSAATGIKRRLLRIESKRLARFETECLNAFDKVAYISRKDADFIQGGNKIIVGNYIKAVPETDCCEHDKNATDIIFLGKMDYEPNIVAVDFFARQVLPVIRQNGNVDCTFHIVGMSPTAAVKRLSDINGVTVTGFVDSITPYLQSAALVVAPMLSGSGVQNKILEAMAHACCVVTTPIGIEGIEHLGEGLVLCEATPSSIAGKIIELIKNPAKRAYIGHKGRRLVYDEFGPENIERQYLDFINPEHIEF